MARDPITRLRTAIDCLPEHVRQAMLDGIRDHRIVVGAYTDGRGGICPMLAAHRMGGRTSFLAFARAWDGFARAERVRPATAREVRMLEDLLVASLAGDPRPGLDLGAAIAEHRAALARRRDEREITARRLRPSRVRLLRARGLSASPQAGPPAAAGEAARTAW